jgi:hypothetical protein
MMRRCMGMGFALTLVLTATLPLGAQTQRRAKVAIVNETGRRLQFVTVVHKYSNVYSKDYTWNNVGPGRTGADMVVTYNTGIGTTGRDWWTVVWMFEGESQLYLTNPDNYRFVLDVAEQAGMIIVPIGAAAIAGAIGGMSSAGVATGAAAAAGAVAGVMLSQAMMNTESTHGFKQHILRTRDANEVTSIYIRPNGNVLFNSHSGDSETGSTTRPFEPELQPDAVQYLQQREAEATGPGPNESEVQGLGPAGSAEGASFNDACDIAQIRLNAGWWIDGVQIVCRDGSAMPLRGGAGGAATAFVLEPGEQLRGMSGSSHGSHGAYVYSLQFHTDRRSSPVYGNGNSTDQGTRPFRLQVPTGARASGLNGSAGQYLHSIGLIVGESAAAAADLSGTYRIQVKATGQFWHEDGGGDRLISTRWQPDDDFTRFILERQADGSYRIRVKASNRYIHVPGHEDWIANTNANVDDDFTRFFLEPQPDGSYRIRQKATGRYLHEDGGTTKMVNTRWQADDDFTRFFLRRDG